MVWNLLLPKNSYKKLEKLLLVVFYYVISDWLCQPKCPCHNATGQRHGDPGNHLARQWRLRGAIQ